MNALRNGARPELAQPGREILIGCVFLHRAFLYLYCFRTRGWAQRIAQARIRHSRNLDLRPSFRANEFSWCFGLNTACHDKGQGPGNPPVDHRCFPDFLLVFASLPRIRESAKRPIGIPRVSAVSGTLFQAPDRERRGGMETWRAFSNGDCTRTVFRHLRLNRGAPTCHLSRRLRANLRLILSAFLLPFIALRRGLRPPGSFPFGKALFSTDSSSSSSPPVTGVACASRTVTR
jgi:hypothetical protein